MAGVDRGGLGVEVERLLGRWYRRRRTNVNGAVYCGSCFEPLHGRLCWNPNCADSVHDGEDIGFDPKRVVIVTEGQSA